MRSHGCYKALQELRHASSGVSAPLPVDGSSGGVFSQFGLAPASCVNMRCAARFRIVKASW